jgi:NADH-quinone oxidoreductase subunit G
MPDLVTLTIDGQSVTVPKGALVIEAATQLGIDVPRFCYHPKLSAVGMCRMCLGEVGMPKMNPDKTPALNEDGTPQIAMMPKPQTLCTTQAAPGMVVLTETLAVVTMRHGVLEFFLANHPLDCPICDKGGECMLQDQTMAYANGLSRVQDLYHLRKDLAKDYPLSDLITLDQERCIQCARCTRFCDEIAQDPVLELMERGSKTQIGTMSDPPFDTKFSGNTIDICPVGALTSRDFRFKARVWELQNVPTVSMADGCGTNIFVGQRNETLVRILPRDNESINECWISDRDRFGLDYVDHDARLTQPLVRRGDALQPATWDEALQLVADKLKSAAPQQVAAVGGAKLTNEGALAMVSLFRDVVQTPNIDCEWQPSLVTPGRPSVTFYEELEMADVILVVGANPNEELPILDLRLKKAAFQRKANLIVCNPYKTPLDRLAKQALLHNAGSEVTLISGLAKLVHQSWTDEPQQTEKLHQHVEGQAGAQAWIDALAPFASSRVAETSGVAEADLRAAATAIANSERLFVLVGAAASPATLRALQNLTGLKGRADYLVVLQPGPNAMGVRRAGLTPGEGGKDGASILRAAAGGDIQVLYIAANNPLPNAADGDLAQRAVDRVPFVVVQTLFENDLTRYADVVLPAATFLEQDGTTTNFHGRVQNLKRAFRPRERRDAEGNTLSACAPDWVIFTKLGQLLGADWKYTNVQQWTQQWKALGAPASAAISFASVAPDANPVVPEGELQLLSSNLLYDGGESFQYCERLGRIVPQPFMQLNREDARRLGIGSGALVEVKSARGTLQVRAKVGRVVKPGTVWLPRRLRHVWANQLIESDQPRTLVTLKKLADAPANAITADMHADGPGQGAPIDPALTTAVVP